MPIDDNNSGIAYKIVYYGAPGAGKTTNLEKISTFAFGRAAGRVTPNRVGANRVASVEIPLGSLGSDGGPNVRVRLETMQGEVSGEFAGWSDTLAGADGIVFVVDSSPRARASSFKALSAIRERLEGGRRAAAATPALIQWNKRDLDDARPVADLETELNHACVPSIEGVALKGRGVADTLFTIVGRTLAAAQRRAGGSMPVEAELRHAVAASIEQLRQAAEAESTRRFGSTIAPLAAERLELHESPPPRYEVIESRETLFSAESLDVAAIPVAAVENPGGERPDAATRMFAALERATRRLSDAAPSEWPDAWMAGLLSGSRRSRGALVIFRTADAAIEVREAVPAGTMPIGGAASLCSRAEAVVLTDIEDPSGRIPSVLVVPFAKGDRSFGGLIVHQTADEEALSPAEQDYWKTAAVLATAHLAGQSAGSRAIVSRPTPIVPRAERAERSEL